MKRLDRQDLLENSRRHGATKTFMAQTCDKFVENLGRAKLCYVLPKYVLRYAWERSGDMRAAMRLALASEVEKVDDAACHGDTCKKPLCLSLCCKMDRRWMAIVISLQGLASPSILSSFLGCWTRMDG